MRILVYPHDLSIGGSQLNAIELAGAVSALGHEVAVFGVPGPLVERIDELGLEFIPSPSPRRRPSPAVLRALVAVIKTRDIEVVHGYEWPPALESWIAARRASRSRTHTSRPVATATVMSMAVADFLPRTAPLLVGTAQIANAERRAGRRRVGLLEPPVDLTLNSPEMNRGVAEFRARHALEESAATVVMVTRLARELKLEGVLTAIDTVAHLSRDGRRPQLVIVGGGPVQSEVRARAQAANARCGRRAVVLTGNLTDPRPAYAAADIVMGMGGSALRAMAFAKPLVVQGEAGFWQPLTPQTIDQFRWTGWYGVGDGVDAGPSALAAALVPLLDDSSLRADRGAFSLAAVQRFSLTAAARAQVLEYAAALAASTGTAETVQDCHRTAYRYGRYFIRQRAARLRRIAAADDFNSLPVAASEHARSMRGPT